MIGYVVKRFPRLSETFIINELRVLAAMGTRVTVFSLTEPEEQQQYDLLADLDVPVYYLPGRDTLNGLTLTRRNYANGKVCTRGVRKWLKAGGEGSAPFPGKRLSQCANLQVQAAVLAGLVAAQKIAHMHAHFASDAATVAMLASRLSDTPWSMTAHAKDIFHTYTHPQTDQAFLRTKLREAAFTVTVSDYNRRYLQQLAGADAIVHRLYNGVDLQRLQACPAPREHRLIVAVGRLIEKKGFTYLLDACAIMRQRGIDFHCIIVGDGPLKQKLSKRIQRLGIESCCHLYGALPQTEVLDWLRRATLSVLPCVVGSSGDRDGLPTVLLEAMALATPVVSTTVAGIPEMIDEETGWLVAPEDGEALAETLGHVLMMTDMQRHEVGLKARQKAERLFDLHRNVGELNVLFSGGKVHRQQVVMGTV